MKTQNKHPLNLYTSNPYTPNPSPTMDSPINHNNLAPNVNPSSSTFNLSTQKSNPLKRKVTKEELETFAKHLNISTSGPSIKIFKRLAKVSSSSLVTFLLRGFDFWVSRLEVDEEELKSGGRLLWLLGLSEVGDGFGASGLDM